MLNAPRNSASTTAGTMNCSAWVAMTRSSPATAATRSMAATGSTWRSNTDSITGHTVEAIRVGDGPVTGFSAVDDNDSSDHDTLTDVEIVQFSDAVLDASLNVQMFDGADNLVGTFETIQEAVDAAAGSDGYTIMLKTGVYEEQVVVDNIDNLTIAAFDGADVTIMAPADVTQTATSHPTGTYPSGRAVNAIVTVLDSANVVIEGITIDGAGNAGTVDGTSAQYVGAFYQDASGGLEEVDVIGIRDAYAGGTTLGGNDVVSGIQRGVGVIVDNATLMDFFMHGGSISDFQKNATAFVRADLDISGVVITGGGAQTINAQNGIQASFSTGTIDDVTITGIGYAGPQVVYSGAMLLFGNTNLDVTNNTIVGANDEDRRGQVGGIYVLDFGSALYTNSGGQITGNDISHVDFGNRRFRPGEPRHDPDRGQHAERPRHRPIRITTAWVFSPVPRVRWRSIPKAATIPTISTAAPRATHSTPSAGMTSYTAPAATTRSTAATEPTRRSTTERGGDFDGHQRHRDQRFRHRLHRSRRPGSDGRRRRHRYAQRNRECSSSTTSRSTTAQRGAAVRRGRRADRHVRHSIQEAVDASGSVVGAVTILVGDGTYVENVVIDRSDVTLLSVNGRGAMTITGDGTGGELGRDRDRSGREQRHHRRSGPGLHDHRPRRQRRDREGRPSTCRARTTISTSSTTRSWRTATAGLTCEFGHAITNILIDGNELLRPDLRRQHSRAASASASQFDRRQRTCRASWWCSATAITARATSATTSPSPTTWFRARPAASAPTDWLTPQGNSAGDDRRGGLDLIEGNTFTGFTDRLRRGDARPGPRHRHHRQHAQPPLGRPVAWHRGQLSGGSGHLLRQHRVRCGNRRRDLRNDTRRGYRERQRR